MASEGSQTISRAFNLLHLFTDERPEWSLSDLVSASGLKKTTTFRLLAELEHQEVLQRTDTGNYALGSQLIVFGGRAMRTNRLRKVVRPYLQRLAQQTTESTTLDVLRMNDATGPKSMVIDEVLGTHLLGITQYVGVRFPAHATATGKTLLAFQASETQQAALLSPLMAETQHTITTSAALREELDTVQERGFALAMHELEIGIMATAAPIFGVHGDIQAAISIGGSSGRIDEEKLTAYGQLAKETAMTISRQLGYEG